MSIEIFLFLYYNQLGEVERKTIYMNDNLISEKEHEEDLKRISILRYIDDDFMSICFDGFIEGAELVLNTILDRSDLSVISVKTQVHISRFDNRSIWLDVLAVDRDNKIYNIEIQRSDSGASFKRARYHSSALDSKYLMKGKNFSELPETYVIFITENDVIGEDKPIYFVERIIIDSDKSFDDGEHIIYVNGAYKDDGTELGRLMHDFFCTNPDDMNFDVLAKRARYYKEDEKGVMTMCKVLEDMRNEVREEAREEGRKEGEQRGLILAYLQNEISQSAVMRILNITDDKFNDLVACYNQ